MVESKYFFSYDTAPLVPVEHVSYDVDDDDDNNNNYTMVVATPVFEMGSVVSRPPATNPGISGGSADLWNEPVRISRVVVSPPREADHPIPADQNQHHQEQLPRQEQQHEQERQQQQQQQQQEAKEGSHLRSVVVGAGIASGLVGLLVLGPVVGLMVGLGTAYAAREDSGVAGDTARAVGDVALTVADKARKINQHHHVVERSHVAAQTAWARAKELNQEHRVVERTHEAVINGVSKTVEFVERKRLVERSVEWLGKAVSWFAGLVNETLKDAQGNRNNKDGLSPAVTGLH